jgi:hypothetical protein
METNQIPLKRLKSLLKEHRQHHNIKSYGSLKKAELVNEFNKWFTIKDDNLYVGGGNKNAGYVRRMESQKKIIFDKIHNPSQWMINKYGNNQVAEQFHPVYDDGFYEMPQIFDAAEEVDFNVGRPKKATKKSKKNVQPTEAQEEQAERARLDRLQQRQSIIDEYESIKKQVVDCKKKLGLESTKYHAVIEEVKSTKGMRKVDKDDRIQKVIHKHRMNNQKIKDGFPQLYEYIKNTRLDEDDLNAVHIHLRAQLARL